MVRQHIKAIVVLAITVLGLSWKFLLTRQFSLLTGYESSNQAYAWYHFVAVTLKNVEWPLWDPYSFCGRTFLGEMQTAAFYPLNLLLAAVPLNNQGLLSPAFYHYLYAIAHLTAAYFMFCLCRHGFSLSFSASLLSGLCFSLGGFLSRLGGWPHLYQTGAWLPMILLLFLKALRAHETRIGMLFSSLSGLALGLSVLAGGLHLVFMHVIVVVSAGIAHTFARRAEGSGRAEWWRTAWLGTTTLCFGLASSAVQLLPSAEYSYLAIRYLGHGSMPASEKIPYHLMADNLFPTALVGLLFGSPATGVASGEYINAYFGVLPLFFVAIALWRCWGVAWVRYLGVLAVASFLYSLGPFSLLHGFAYAVIPKLWVAREATRFMFLADFALVILAGYGLDVLLCRGSLALEWVPLREVCRRFLLACLAALFIPLVFAKAEMSPWVALSLVLMTCSCALILYMTGGGSAFHGVLLVFILVLFDLHAFDWSATNLAQADARGGDQLSRLLSLKNTADFLRKQPGLYRVEVNVDLAPNIGDLFGVPMTLGAGVTIPARYERVRGQLDMLNVRYIVRPSSAQEEGALYEDRFWKVYERPTALPRAWLVHEVIAKGDGEAAIATMQEAGFDPRKVAVIEQPLSEPLDEFRPGTHEEAVVEEHRPNRIAMRTRSQGRSLLVMSEMFYPGWKAAVDGKPATIIPVNHALRGVVVPSGTSTVHLQYAPDSVRIGLALTLAACAACLALAVWCGWGLRGAASGTP